MAELTTNQKELLQFPVDFPIKVMGLNEPDFPKIIEDLARQQFPTFDNSKTTTALSKTGKYISVNIVVHANSREELDNMYRAITSHPKVKVAL